MTGSRYGSIERALILVHRWTGIVLAILMTVWALSGIVMVYVAFPELTDSEHYDGLEPIDLRGCCAESVGDSLAGRDQIVITMMAGRPVARIGSANGGSRTLDLASGTWLTDVPAELAGSVAQSHLAQRDRAASIRSIEIIENDQWTVYQRFHPHRPLFKVTFDSDAGDVVYVSGTSAEVVQDTQATERFWNWLGAVPHWLYYTAFRERQRLWYESVVWASVFGTFLAASGLYLGIRRTMNAGGRWTRYLGAMRWHHLTGLLFGLVTLTWVLSGLFSMNPWGWMESGDGAEARHIAVAVPEAPQVAAALAVSRERLAPDVVAMTITSRSGKLAVMTVDSGATAARLHLENLATDVPGITEIEDLVTMIRPDVPIESLVLLHEEDAYYFGHKADVALPVYRAIVDDAEKTRYYFDAATAQLVLRVDRPAKLYRWLHYGLHRLDFAAAMRIRPLRDLLMLPLLAGVTLLCAMGCWVGYRHLRYG